MAPSNDYLLDEQVQQRLAAHDHKLIKGSTVWFPGEAPEVHWDFNRPKEYELLAAFLDGFSDIDYRDGKVTVDDAARAVYGTADEYLTGRIASTHLNPASGFNKTLANGEVVMMAADGVRIIRDDRMRVAQDRYQEAADKFEHRVVKSTTAAARSLKAAHKRSIRIAPTAKNELSAISTNTLNNVTGQQQLAIEAAEQ